jgi:hypothetical protein
VLFNVKVRRVRLPTFQRLPYVADDESLTFVPGQRVVGPEAVMVGAGGAAVTVTATGGELLVEHPDTTPRTV